MKKIICFICILLTINGCKEKYDSPVVSPNKGYLVVEGTINPGNTTEIILKRTVKLDNPTIVYESGAIVTVLGDDNSIYPLNENGAGHYQNANLTLNKLKKYKLHIQTKDTKVYESDFVDVQNTPALDSISKQYNNDGLGIYVNSHDPSGLTKYYQWDYNETWQYNSPYKQLLIYQQLNTPAGIKYFLGYFDPVLISFNAAIYSCWPTENSSTIITGSTVTLTDNKIYLPLTFISRGSVKLGITYSILARQYSLSEGKYNYLQKMKKNTEGTGSVFDAQPSELMGNIHCTTNLSEPVIGYIDICNIQEKRIFIKNAELPNWNYEAPCVKVEIPNNIDTITFVHDRFYPFDVAKMSQFGGILSYYFSTPSCVDCTFFGTNKKPSFWP